MRISDWSSDVCSSDLDMQAGPAFKRDRPLADVGGDPVCRKGAQRHRSGHRPFAVGGAARQIDLHVAGVQGISPGGAHGDRPIDVDRSEEHTSELPSLMRISYAGFSLKKKIKTNQ